LALPASAEITKRTFSAMKNINTMQESKAKQNNEFLTNNSIVHTERDVTGLFIYLVQHQLWMNFGHLKHRRTQLF